MKLSQASVVGTLSSKVLFTLNFVACVEFAMAELGLLAHGKEVHVVTKMHNRI